MEKSNTNIIYWGLGNLDISSISNFSFDIY